MARLAFELELVDNFSEIKAFVRQVFYLFFVQKPHIVS